MLASVTLVLAAPKTAPKDDDPLASHAYAGLMAQQRAEAILDVDVAAGEQFPALRARQHTVGERTDRARSLLWQAFQVGELTSMQFRQTLDRLEPGPKSPPVPADAEPAMD